MHQPWQQNQLARTSWSEKLLVALAMAALSIAMTWPLARDLGTAVNDYGDPLLNAWILWWDTHALATPGASLFDAPMFHPHPMTLAYSEHIIVSALTAAPVFWLGGGAILAHNLVFLFSFMVAGLGAYLLTYELTQSRAAAWVAALGFAFAPYRFGHLGHLQLQTAHFMPLVLLYLHRWARAPRWGTALGFGLFWLLQILSCGYYALYISLTVGLFVLFYGVPGKWWRQAARLVQLGVVTLIVALAVLPFFLPYLTVQKDLGFVRTQAQAAGFAAEPRYYLAAPPANRLYGEGTTRFRGAEGELFLGLVLSGLALLGFMRPSAEETGPAIGRGGRAWLMAAVAAGLVGAYLFLAGKPPPAVAVSWALAGAGLVLWRTLALGGPATVWRAGPARWLGIAPGRSAETAWGHVEPAQVFYLLLAALAFWASLGPRYGLYAVLYHLVPGFDSLRVPARLAVLVTLAWAVLAGYGARRLTWFCGGGLRGGVVVALACVLVLAESCSVPVPWLKVYDQPPPVYEWLAQEPAGTVVVELPAMGHQGDMARDARYLFWSTTHGKRLVNGYSGFFPADYKELAPRLKQPTDPWVLDQLAKRGVRYLVVHLKEYGPTQQRQILEAMESCPRLKPVFASRWERAYRLMPAAEEGLPAK